MSFQKDFDALLDAMLTDYRNQFPGVDISQGSLIFIKSACLASALWGLYKHQEWVARQIFPDTADTASLEHHAWVRGLARTYGETDAALLDRLLTAIRMPPAGGNKNDYEQWALSIDNVAAAWCFPLAQGLGTVDVVILSNRSTTGTESPSSYRAVTGTNTSVSSYKLINSGATFQTAGIEAGDPVRNSTANRETRVVAVDSQTQLSLAADIFTAGSQGYTITTKLKGSATSVATGKLIDSGATFQSAGVTKGDIVKNAITGRETRVVAVDSQTQLGLAEDLFVTVGQAYAVTSLIRRVKDRIDDQRPVTASQVRVLGPSSQSQNVTMTVTGAVDRTAIADDITAYLSTFIPKQTLYRAKLIQIALDNGAENAEVTTPSADVTPAGYGMLRPGTINVT